MSAIKTKIRLFPYIDDINMMNKLKIDAESISMISPRDIADKISQIIIVNCEKIGLDPEKVTITDANSGVGGNTISFGKHFQYVNAVEIDTRRCNYLKNNVGIYQLNNVAVYCHDYLNVMDKLKQEIVYLDPYWGGRNYKFQTFLRLKISEKSLEDVCQKLTTQTKMTVLKLPLNYDLEYLHENMCNHVKEMYIYRLFKMYILVIIN